MDERLANEATAKARRGEVPGSVAAILDCEIEQRGLDGRRFRFVIASERRTEYLEAEITGTNGGYPGRSFDPSLLEAAIERRIDHGYYRPEWLMDELAVDGPISLREEDLRPHPPRADSAFF